MKKMLTRSIGWGTIGLGLVGIAAPRRVSRTMGYGDRPRLVLALAARDLVIGVGLVAAADPRPWLRARLCAEIGDTVMHAAAAMSGAFDRKRAIPIAVVAAVGGAFEYALLRSTKPR